MARPNFFCSVEALQWLLEHEPKSERDDIDLTVDLIEAPYLFIYTSDAEAWELKVMQRGELYDHKSGSGVEKGSLRVVKETGDGSGTTSDPVLHDNMGAFFEACRRLSRYICDEQLEPMYDGLDPEEAGILLEADGGKLSARKVEGRARPELMCDTLFGGTVMMRPYMEDFMERSMVDEMSVEEKIEKAEGGDLFAIAQLAEAYLNGGDEVEQDPAKAAYWYRREAEQENSEGAFNLGLLYAKGFGVERDFTQAAKWMEKAVAWGDPDGAAPAEQYRKIEENLKKAEAGDAAAMAELAGDYMMLGGSLDQAGAGDDYAQSLRWAQKAVDAGCAAGYWPLALAYEHGRGVAEDHAQATELFRKGAELGDPNCQHSYGCRLINGDGVKKDAAQACALFERSAEQGYALAFKALAHMYETGEGVEPDFDKELEYFEKSCEAEPDNAELLRHTGFQYTNLMEVDEAHWLRGVQRAAFWLRRAADLGDMASMHGADMYEKILALHEEGKIPAGTPMGDCMRILSDNGMPEEATPFSPFADPDWEEQWKQQREEYERKAAKEWLAAHEKELDRGAKIVFADKKFVFDGTPDAELFEEVLAKLAEKGGVHRSAVSGKTDYLVCEPRRAGESKLRNLMEQRVKGRCKDTKVVLAEDFYRALGYDPEPEIRVEEPEEAPAPEQTAPESEPAAAIVPETVFAPLAEDVETDENGLPIATPGEDQHPHLDFLNRTKGVLTMFGGVVNQTGTEYAFYSLRDDSGYREPVRSALKRAVSKDRGGFALSERAKEMAEVFRVEIDCFDPGEDREQQILNGMLRRCTMYNDLRSFAWTLAAYCAANAVKPADVDAAALRSIARLVQERDHLNYRAGSYCPALCSGPDLHVYFLPDAASDEDRKTILDNVNEEVAEGVGLSAIGSLDGLRAELTALAPAMEKIHAALEATRDRRRELSGAMADVLFAWCSMTYAARDPIFTEDGPINNFFEHPDQKNVWEEQWKQQREEYERQAAADWLKAHEKDLNRGARIIFSGKKFVFDGSPDGDQWLEILEKLTAKGGVHRAAVSGQTDYLVCDPRRAGDAKIRNIKEQRVKGRCKDTKIVLAEDFYRALGFDPNPPKAEPEPKPKQKAAPAPIDVSMLDNALKLTFENGVRRGDGHYTIGIPDGFALNEHAEGRAFIAYSPDGSDEFDGRIILFDGERNEIDSETRSKLSPQGLCSLMMEGAAYNETLAQMFEEVGSLPLPEGCPPGFASYGIDTNLHCYHCNVVLILGGARKQLRVQIGDVYHEDISACEALVRSWLQTLQTDETPWKIPQTDDPEFAGALTKPLAERWAEVQSASLGVLIGEYTAARDTRVQKYRTLSAKGRDSVEALKRDLKMMLENTGKQFRDHFDRALTVLERFAADEKNLPFLPPMLASVEQELPESDRLSLQLDDEELEAFIPDLQRQKNRLKALEDRQKSRQDPAAAEARRKREEAERRKREEAERLQQEEQARQAQWEAERKQLEDQARLKETEFVRRKEKLVEQRTARNVAEKTLERQRAHARDAASLISCSGGHVAAVREDGTVVCADENRHGRCDVSGWRSVIAVDCDRNNTVGLTKDGRVLIAGWDHKKQSACAEWTGIKQVCVDGSCVLGLRNDGTVAVAPLGTDAAAAPKDVTAWTDIRRIGRGGETCIGLDDNDRLWSVRRTADGCIGPGVGDGRTEVMDAAVGGVFPQCYTLDRDGSCGAFSPEQLQSRQIVKLFCLDDLPAALLSDGSILLPASDRLRHVADFLRQHSGERFIALSGDDVACALVTEEGRVYVAAREDAALKTGEPFGTDFRLFKNYGQLMDDRRSVWQQREKEYRKTEQTAKAAQNAAVRTNTPERKKRDPASFGIVMLVIGALIMLVSIIGACQPYRDTSAWFAPLMVGVFLFCIGYVTVKNQKKK